MRRSSLVICLLLLRMLVSRGTRAGDARTSEAIWRSLNGEADLVALYSKDDAAPLWLDTADYDVDGLRALAQASATTHETEAIAHADVALSRVLLRYLRDVDEAAPEPAGEVYDGAVVEAVRRF